MQQPAPAAPALPAAPAEPNQVTYRPGATNPVSAYEAATAQREVLGNQLEQLQDKRSGLVERSREGNLSTADRAGTEARIAQVDERIASVEKQIAASDAQVAQAAAIPGAVTGHEERIAAMRNARDHGGDPEAPFVLTGIFIVVVLFPLSIALARRLWKKSSAVAMSLPGELMERMSHLDQAMESIAIEVERIGEGQRFMTRVLTDDAGRALGAGAAEPIRQAQRDAAPVRSRETER